MNSYFVSQSAFMVHKEQETSLQALQDIRSIMERSARFISLSGWSGVWAGAMALAGSYIAYTWLQDMSVQYYSPMVAMQFIYLAVGVLIAALTGGVFFTWRKAKQQGGQLWNAASKRMLVQMAIPMTAGGVFALVFLMNWHIAYIAPACLAFYGLALINSSKYTLSDIKYLGGCEVILGCIGLFLPGYGLMLWAIGFGVLHILYGIVMWNKYDKNIGKEQE